MAQFSPQQQQQQPQPDTETKAEAEDFALADSFINYDYVPDPDPVVLGSGCTRVEEAEPEAESVVNLGDLGLCGGIEEGIEKISLVGGGNRDDDDDKGHEMSETDSESSESESDDSSSSTSSESDSDSSDDDNEDEEPDDRDKIELEEGEIVESDDDNDDEDDNDSDGDGDGDGGGGNRAARRRIRSTNELEALPFVPPVNVTLELHHRMLPVGVVMSVVGAQVIVEGVEKHEPLNEGSILWMTESRKLLGLIDEIFGPVGNPYYVVRYNSENEVPKGIRGGTLISFVPEFANHVLNDKDLYEKGYDYDEEGSEEAEFSDDEKEAEYNRKQRMAKRGSNGQNHGKSKNKGKRLPPKEDVAPAAPSHDQGNCSTFSGNGQGHFGSTIAAPAAPLRDQGHSSAFSGHGQGPFGATAVVPPFPPANAGPSLTTNGVWTNGATLQPQPQPAMLPNGFPTNGIPWFSANTQIPQQFPVPGVPFQQQLNPNQVLFSAQLLYALGLAAQNQMTCGLSSPFSQVQPPICPGQLGFPSASSSIPFNHQAPNQFHPGASSNHGRKNFHPGGRKGWRQAK